MVGRKEMKASMSPTEVELFKATERITELEAENKELRDLLRDVAGRIMPLYPICIAVSQADAAMQEEKE